MKGNLKAAEVSAPDSRMTFQEAVKRALTGADVLWGEETVSKRVGRRAGCAEKGQACGRGGGGGVAESPQSMHVITSPLNWCQGPSAAVILIKCSWCCEQSA